MMFAVAAMAHAGSVYVPVDSWTYPAAERLAVLTETRLEVLGLRPWTRLQFARFLERAREMPHGSEADGLQSRLEAEFAPELNGQSETVKLESTYTRNMEIAGTPIRDSYHFGQTIVNDFGRPYGQGLNSIEGASGYAQERATMLYVRGEYQHGASLRAPSLATLDAEAIADSECGIGACNTSKVLSQGGPAVDHFRLLDSYVGASFAGFTATLGKQSLWYGPGAGGAMLESNNAEPIWMARLTNDFPARLPVLGHFRMDMFYGQLQGRRYLPGPWLHGETISFQPFSSLEIGFTRTVQFLGDGRPFTWRRLWRSYFNLDDGPRGSASNTTANDPGDRRSSVTFTWKLPRVPAKLYLDSFSDDDPSPLANPSRASYHPGLYIAELPGALHKLDLRMEGGFTSSVNGTIPPGFNYWNTVYKDGYTNKGLMIGDAIGRESVYLQGWSTYWLSPRNKIQLSYRHRTIGPRFMPGGGTQGVFSATSNMMIRQNFELELGFQSERNNMPLLLGSGAKFDTTGWTGIRFWPSHKAKPRTDDDL